MNCPTFPCFLVITISYLICSSKNHAIEALKPPLFETDGTKSNSDGKIFENYLFEQILRDQKEKESVQQIQSRQLTNVVNENIIPSDSEISRMEHTGPVYYNAHIIKEGTNQPYITFNLNKNPANPWQKPIDLHIPFFHKASKVKVILPKLPKPKIVFSQKHYRITVVRPTLPPPVLPPPPPEIDEQTLIYVLIKKPNETDLEPPIIPHQNDTLIMHQPEVFFITYKTHHGEKPTGNDEIISETLS